MQIIITPEDIKKIKLSNSDSGMVIDELAFASKQYTSGDLNENSFDYEPREVYDFDYETDLLENTKTWKELSKLLDEKIAFEAEFKKSGLQAGAWLALNYPNTWNTLLEGWEETLKENRFDSPSSGWNTEMEKAIDSFHDDQYKEWLNGGQERDNNGVIYEISKYFTDNTDGEYDQKSDEYTFGIDDAHELFCNCYEDDCKDYSTEKEVKSRLLSDICDSSSAVKSARITKREQNRAEYAKVKAYKDGRIAEAKAARKAKLETMKL